MATNFKSKPEAKPAATPLCEYAVSRDDNGKLVECRAPAHFRGVKGPRLFYCRVHGDAVRMQFEVATLDGVSVGKPIKWFNPR